ncbi:MAG: response regulator [Polyangiaceae bacterium]|nr:response regulator [Polyangiaceae bacterium]MCW5790409.1 response regulator [Polyangiaceae bacterium]
MHPLLAAQLQLTLAGATPPGDAWWQRFVEQVSAAYYQAEAEREELKRALDESERGRAEQASQLSHELEQRTEFEQALADSRAELHEVLAAMPDQVWLVEADGTLVDPRPRVPTLEVSELMAALCESGELDAACKRARHEGALVKWEFPATVDGRRGLYEARCVPHPNSRGIVLVRDLTELAGAGPLAPGPRHPAAALARVLIVDDEADVGRAMRRSLIGRYHITLTRSGVETLELFRDQRFDLVICDLMMPEMSGMDLLDHAARRYPEQATRFVFMTGGAFSDTGKRFLGQLTTEYLKKPFDQGQLRDFIAQHLERLGPLTAIE